MERVPDLMDGTKRVANRKTPAAAVVVVVLLSLAVLLVALAGHSAEAGAQAAPPKEKLAELRVSPEGSMEGYSRGEFPHWSDAQEYGWKLPAGTPDPGSCDTREAALIRDGTKERVGSGCSVSTGRWFDPYTGNVYRHSSDMDGDHVVALAESFRSGAKGWGARKKERFANAPMEVMMVEDDANASKGTGIRRRGSRRGGRTTASTRRSGSTSSTGGVSRWIAGRRGPCGG